MEKDGDNGGRCLVTGKAVLIAFITDEGCKIKKHAATQSSCFFFREKRRQQ